MKMLYKAVGGAVQESHYGLALAGVVPLPPQVLSDATQFAHILERRLQRKKKTSKNVIKERRRTLILDLKEHLVQAHNGALEGDLLASWLRKLQKEFVNRMTVIEAEAEKAEASSDEEQGDDEYSDEMRDRSVIDGDEYEPRPDTIASQPSVVTIDSRDTSTESSSTIRASITVSSIRAVSENDY
jgi:DNA mismatch repair protein MSH4